MERRWSKPAWTVPRCRSIRRNRWRASRRCGAHSTESSWSAPEQVLTKSLVGQVAEAGAQFVVAPNVNEAVIAAAKRRGLAAIPGFLTPTEAFSALNAGADALKLFPADQAGPGFIKAIRAVLPSQTLVFAVGGVSEPQIAPYLAAGAHGFGLGSNLYKAGDAPAAVHSRAAAFVAAMREAIQR